jgi:ribonuclease P protein component
LEKKIRYTLGKQERLKSRKVIENLFKEGKSFSIFPFRLLFAFEKKQPSTDNNQLLRDSYRLQAGFTASSRHFKKAVDRNRIKRLMREAYRLQKNELESLCILKGNSLALFLIYVGKELPLFELVYEKTGLILKRLIKLTGENK